MKVKAIFLADSSDARIEKAYDESVRNRLAEKVDLLPVYINQENAELHIHDLHDAEIAFSTWGVPNFSEAELQRFLPNLKILFYAAGSVQRFARPFMSRNVIVISAWAANAIPVIEFTAAQILLANKGFAQSARFYKQHGDYRQAQQISRAFPGNYSARVGILGAGMIGRGVIEMLSKHELAIDVFDPFLSDERAAELKVRKTDLIDIFSNCDTISNHLANLPATVGILNKEHFDRMLPHATFINTGRGAQVVEADLIKALREVSTRTAILDVTAPEPVPENSPFLQLDNVLLTPHIAGSMNKEIYRMGLYMEEECERYLNGTAMRYEVKLEMLETLA
ncbi:hydroxyacid dehydrogenase [Paenibacillus radicis (ex Xue et al. 2023)]|uniref:Hydroxyacid dehydrogenase n=1 Tax=Paenibacillus radicis (ex Xue et al. 2023) TaxID=2972489 RepID=A0ABT1YEI7_9BACL|nr:hydroxyacid dehydrogenase [Paenibacillus radicis (ex Xue et al. 2023)]MCR8631598.1 hydroxyacid dehydrogenase [Paenibacillus radicis (ex Xue et al. 2023)]